MKEFGSDFHLIDSYNSGRLYLTDVHRDAILMADGRQSLVILIRQEGWRRLWMPEYFCYEVIEAVRLQTGIDIVSYPDFPLADDRMLLRHLPFKEGDVLLRINYFGRRGYRSNTDIPVPVIEDHSHDLFGEWARMSDADWCVVSLRKTLPIAGGGAIWSPKGHLLPMNLSETNECKKMMSLRWKAMEMKADYLSGKVIRKDDYRKLYAETEEWFDKADASGIDERSKKVINGLDILAWNKAKQRNWNLLNDMLSNVVQVLQPERTWCNMFSFVFLTESRKKREILRRRLIERSVYPAILWHMPETVSKEVQNFGCRMLSIHCDGRYSEDNMRQLAEKIQQSLES